MTEPTPPPEAPASAPPSCPDLAAYERQRAALYAALAKWQAGVSNPGKDQTARVKLKSGGTMSYSYTSLAGLLKVAHTVGAFGLAVRFEQRNIDGRPYVEAVLCHEEGGEVSSGPVRLEIDSNALLNGSQNVARANTSARRLALQMVLGLASTDDDQNDGNPAEVDDRAASAAPSRERPKAHRRTAAARQAPPDPMSDEAQDQPPAERSNVTDSDPPADEGVITPEELERIKARLNDLYGKAPDALTELAATYRETFDVSPKIPFARGITTTEQIAWLDQAIDAVPTPEPAV